MTAAGQIDITTCDREPIHLPGAIQPHGLLLIANRQSLEIAGGAGDIAGRLALDWLGVTLAEILGQPLDAAREELAGSGSNIAVLDQVVGFNETFDAVARITGEWLVVELEPAPQQMPSGKRLLALTAISAAFDRTVDLKTLCDAAAIAFRKLTGFDRVMIYRFLDDDAGNVVAEDSSPDIGSFLNHHFPASDIPVQARALYVRNLVRVIPDAHYAPALVCPGSHWDTLDMSDIALRSVSPIHIQYLKNMDVGASASISIVKDGALWGLVACHNKTPKQLGFETRLACATLAADLSRQIRAKDDAEMYRQRIRLRTQEDAIVSHLGVIGSLDAFLASTGDEVCRMLGANGFAAVQKTELFSAGICPGDSDIMAVANWVRLRANTQPFFTDSLASEFPEATAFQARASGLLAVTMSTEEPTILMWFRAEQLETVNWAGNPHKPVVAGKTLELSPRASFAAWSETVEGRSAAWSLGEVEAANRLQRRMFDVQQRHRMSALNLELIATIADKEILLVQKDFLIKEVNHRVQNSLQLVSAFLGMQSRESHSDMLKTQLNEAQRRLSAVSLVHRRLYSGDQVQTVDLARYLDDLCTDMKASMGEEWASLITLDLAPVLVATDRAVSIGLILTELVINANKYAYAGKPGPITIQLAQGRTTFRLVVTDQGIGKIVAREGFGSRMLNAMIVSLGGAIEEHNTDPGLQVVVSAPVRRRA